MPSGKPDGVCADPVADGFLQEHAPAHALAAAERVVDLDATKRRLQETTNDLAMRNKLVDKVSRELSEKEMSLAKSLGVIRRLEEDLNRLCPDPSLIARVAVPASLTATPFSAEPEALTGPAIPPAPEPLTLEASAPEGALPPSPTPYTIDDPPPPPAYIEPVPIESPKAQQALLKFMKRIFPGQPH